MDHLTFIWLPGGSSDIHLTTQWIIWHSFDHPVDHLTSIWLSSGSWHSFDYLVDHLTFIWLPGGSSDIHLTTWWIIWHPFDYHVDHLTFIWLTRASNEFLKRFLWRFKKKIFVSWRKKKTSGAMSIHFCRVPFPGHYPISIKVLKRWTCCTHDVQVLFRWTIFVPVLQ